MKRNQLLKGAVGFAVGLMLWLFAGPAYHPIVATATQQLFNLAESPNVTQLQPSVNDVILNRTDFDSRSPRPQIPLRDLTFNVILLLTLLAAAGPPLSLKYGGRWLTAFLALFAVHVAALTAKVMTLYVLRLGAWSQANYGSFARNFWSGSDHFYRFIGIYAAAFAIWWIARVDETEKEPKQARPRRRKG